MDESGRVQAALRHLEVQTAYFSIVRQKASLLYAFYLEDIHPLSVTTYPTTQAGAYPRCLSVRVQI